MHRLDGGEDLMPTDIKLAFGLLFFSAGYCLIAGILMAEILLIGAGVFYLVIDSALLYLYLKD